MKRIVSVHIPKTAGTSFGESLSEIEGNSVFYDYADKPINQPRETRLNRAKENFDACRLPQEPIIHGHFLPLKYKFLTEPKSAFFITWLREPIARLESHYNFWRNTTPPVPTPPLRKKMLDENWSFFDFATEPALQNLYHQFFEGFDLASFDFIGLTERYQEDLQRCATLLEIPLAMKFSNKRKRDSASPLSEKQLSEVRRFHQLDISLYQQVKQQRENQ